MWRIYIKQAGAWVEAQNEQQLENLLHPPFTESRLCRYIRTIIKGTE